MADTCDICKVEMMFADAHGPGKCDGLEQIEDVVPQPMTIAEILKAFENAKGIDEVYRLFHETEPPVDALDQRLIRDKLAPILKTKDVSVKAVDAWFRVKAEEAATRTGLLIPEPEPWPAAVDGAELIADLEAYFHRFLHAPAESILGAALWTVWTHCFDVFDIAPLLVLTSPTKRCGKTTALKLIGSVAARPLFSSNLTGSALFRTIEKYRPSLLIDEADNFSKFNDDLKGLLNAGHERMTAQAVRVVGDDHEPKTFSTWSPKAFTAIGSLPDTVEDRSIRLVMLRKPAEVKKDRARRRAIRSAAEPLAQRCVRWAADNEVSLTSMPEPDLEAVHDRAADNWAPLLVIAELCGVRERAEQAAVALTSGEEAGVNELLLAHVKEAFGEEAWIGSVDLLEALVSRDDGPWPKWWAGDLASSGGTKKAAADLARRLRKFDPNLKAHERMIGGVRSRGYDRAVFEDAWHRWLPSEGVSGETREDPGNLEHLEHLAEEPSAIPPLTSANAGVRKVREVRKVSEPSASVSSDAVSLNGIEPGDIVRQRGGLKSKTFRVKAVEDGTVHAFDDDQRLRSFHIDDVVFVRRGED